MNVQASKKTNTETVGFLTYGAFSLGAIGGSFIAAVMVCNKHKDPLETLNIYNGLQIGFFVAILCLGPDAEPEFMTIGVIEPIQDNGS